MLPHDDVEEVGAGAVAARADDGPATARDWDCRGMDARRASLLRDTRVATAGGRALGAATDVRLDERTGAVTGRDMTRGERAGRAEQRSLILRTDDVIGGPDALIVPEAAARVDARRLAELWVAQ